MTILTPPADYNPETRHLIGPKGVRRVSKKRHVVLMLLAKHYGRFVHKDTLVMAMYPDDEPEDPYANLRVAVFFLRDLLRTVGAPDRIVTTYGDGYVLDLPGRRG